MKYYFTRAKVIVGSLLLLHISSDENLADIYFHERPPKTRTKRLMCPYTWYKVRRGVENSIFQNRQSLFYRNLIMLIMQYIS